jgi:hypothetical protein
MKTILDIDNDIFYKREKVSTRKNNKSGNEVVVSGAKFETSKNCQIFHFCVPQNIRCFEMRFGTLV